jgi:hypothetical protein
MPAIKAKRAPLSVIIKYKTIANEKKKRRMFKAEDWPS